MRCNAIIHICQANNNPIVNALLNRILCNLFPAIHHEWDNHQAAVGIEVFITATEICIPDGITNSSSSQSCPCLAPVATDANDESISQATAKVEGTYMYRLYRIILCV